MGIKSFFKELDGKKVLIDEFKEAILEGAPERVRGLDEGKAGMEVLIGAFMSVGNEAYHSGDFLSLRYFMSALLELEEQKLKSVDYQKFSDIVLGFGLRAIRDIDRFAFAAVVKAVSDSVCGLKGKGPVNRHVEALIDLAMKAASEGLENFSLEVVGSLGDLDVYFEAEGLSVSRVSLRNALVNLVYSLPEGPLKERVTVEAERVLGREESTGFESAVEEVVMTG